MTTQQQMPAFGAIPTGTAPMPGSMLPTSAPLTHVAPGKPESGAGAAGAVPLTAGATSTANPVPHGTATGGSPIPVTPQPAPSYATPSSPGGISAPITETPGSEGLNSALKDTYGGEIGTALGNTLSNLGTSTDKAVQATNEAALLAASKQQANIASGLAASGISADSSTNALAQGDFAATVNADLASTDANMQLNEQNTLISSLMAVGKEHGADGSTWDSVLGWAGL